MKNYIIILVTFFLVACNEGHTSKDSIESPVSASGNQTISTVQFKLQEQGEINRRGSLNIPAEFNQLDSDDAVYLSVISEDIESGKLTVEPKDALLYPTNGKANVVLLLTDIGLSRSTNISVKLTTSSGDVIKKIVNVTLGE
jgi:hypothetical protein